MDAAKLATADREREPDGTRWRRDITLYQVARCARFSSATVSRVLNNRPGVSRAVRARVFLQARGLAGRSRSIGVLLSNFETPYFLDIYRAVAARIPTVIYDVRAPGPHIASIRVDYRRGMDKLIAYLYSLGHRRLGFVGNHGSWGALNGRQRVVLCAGRYAEPSHHRDRLRQRRNGSGSIAPSAHISCQGIGSVICNYLFGPPALMARQFVIDAELVLRGLTGLARSCGATDPQVL